MSAVEEIPDAEIVPQRTDVAQLDVPITGGEMAVLYRLGKGLAAAGMFKDATQANQAFAKLIFGRDLGLSATQAMTGIYIIEGKPEMSANLQASKVKSSGRYDYRVLRIDNDVCEIEFGPAPAPMKDEDGVWLPWPDAFGVSAFSQGDVTTAGLSGKDNHKKYPRNMLFARALSNGVAWYCPDVMNGIRVYAEGELADVSRVDAAAEPEAAPVAEPEPEDAEVVSDPMLTDDARSELVQAF